MIDTADNNQQVKLNLMNNSENVLGVTLKHGISFYCNLLLINTIPFALTSCPLCT